MKTLFLALCLLLAALFQAQLCHAKTENDRLFPPAEMATNAINFDGRGFIINGRRTFIMSGSIHYSRVPRENWRDILLKLKRSGFNTVETYVFWSYHEAHEGQFDFTTDSRDLGAFLDTARDLGLYAIIRVGPYSCSEWENGGFPNWMYFKPKLEVRKDNQPFLDAVDAWFNKMLPIISSRQISRGGNVILVQLENEYPAGGWKYWGTETYGPYFQHLLDLAHTNGLEVPMFFSGLHHGHDPAPATPIDPTMRISPWMSTELWTIWFDRYGSNAEDLLKGERAPWRVLAEGGSGLNLYMFYGGTTFGFYNFNNDTKFGDRGEKGAASYDFGTLIGQSGDTRQLYLRLKRLGYFAETFSTILADSTNATKKFQNFAQGIPITARTAPEGTLVFLNNLDTNNDATAVLKSGVSVKLAAGEIIGLPFDIPLAPGLRIAEADTRILGIIQQNGFKTIVCYGETGGQGRITFGSEAATSAKAISDASFKFDSQNQPSLTFQFPPDRVGEEVLVFGEWKIRLLVMNEKNVDKTWFVDTSAGRQIVIGAPYLGEFRLDASGKVHAIVDYPWNEAAPDELAIYGGGDAQKIRLPLSRSNKSPVGLHMAKWEVSADNAPLADKFDDGRWFASGDGNPPEMGEDGDYSPYAWYRTHLTNGTAINSLNFNRIGDRATFFLDGRKSATFDFKNDKRPDISIDIPPGAHQLTVFAAHAGRPKFAGYIGPIDGLPWKKGLSGPVTCDGTNTLILNWKMRGGVTPGNAQMKWSGKVAPDGAPAYYRTSFRLNTLPDPGATYRFVTDGLSFGCVWLNGHNLGRFPEIVKGCPGLWLPGCWMKKGGNTFIVYDEQGNSPEKTSVRLETDASRHRIVMDGHETQ